MDLKFPQTTIVGKPVPKNAFYKHLEVNAKIKQHFVGDVVSIHWLYKLTPSTINVEDGKLVHEIVVFSSSLKSKDCPDDVFLFIDQNMPRHVVFILEYESRYKVLLNYKEWKDGQNGPFKIIKTFATEWLTESQLSLTLEGQNMDALYEAMAGQVSGFGTKKAEDTKRIVALEGLIDKAKREVNVLQRQIRNERQLNRQMELNGEARGIKKQIALWQNELQKIKK
ncbi:MAG: DUF4391 domain-containing protein [Bacteroidales bacterium]|nr:DUF4391 domain-containing protein [Bacteroidales bacterium]